MAIRTPSVTTPSTSIEPRQINIPSSEEITKAAQNISRRIFPQKPLSQQECFEELFETCKKKQWVVIGKVDETSLNHLVNQFGRSLLLQAIHEFDFPLAQEFLQKGIAVPTCDPEGNSALHYAVRTNDLELISQVWEKVEIDTTNLLGQTPLHLAAEAGQGGAVLALIENGAQLNALASWQQGATWLTNVTPLALSVIGSHRQCVDILLNGLSDISQQIRQIGNILHLCIHFHLPSMLTYLLTEHFSRVKPLIDAKNEQGQTPLMLASYLGESPAIVLLIEKGANIKAENHQGRTALHWAALGKQSNSIKLLVYYSPSNDCLINLGDRDGNYPKDLITDEDNESLSIKNLLINLSKQRKKLEKMPPLFSYKFPENLVFKGGGSKGIAYVGVVEVLEEEGVLKDVRRVAGTSAGAINATALAMGYSAGEMYKILGDTDLTSFLDHPLTQTRIQDALKIKSFSDLFRLLTLCKTITNPITWIKTLWKTTGVCQGEEFRKWMEGLISRKTGKTHCTFGELRHLIETGGPFKHLHVFTVRLGPAHTIAHISSEDASWDDIIISDAVRASMSIPAVFKPHILHVKGEGQRVPAKNLGSFVDGGVLCNFPIDAFDRKKYQSSAPLGNEGEYPILNKRTLGFSLYSPQEKIPVPKIVETAGELLKGIISLYFHAEGLSYKQIPYNKFRVIEIDNTGVKTTEFGLSNEKKKALMKSGKNSTQKFFDEQKKLSSQEESLFLFPRIIKEAQGLIYLKNTHPDFVGRADYLKALR